MPAFFAAVGAWLSTITVTQVVVAVGSMLLQNHMARRNERKATKEFNSKQQDRHANVLTTESPRELVLGRVRKGGAVYFRGSTGHFKTTFFMHMALAGHEIDAVEQVYFNDLPVTIDGNGRVMTSPYYTERSETANKEFAVGGSSVTLDHDPIAGSVGVFRARRNVSVVDSDSSLLVQGVDYTLSGRDITLAVAEPEGYATTVTYQYVFGESLATIWWELGSASSLADPRTRELTSLWTTAHRARGVAKLMAEFRYSETAFPNGLPNVTVLIRGAKVYDPRSSTTAWTDNPALLVRHVYQHAYFGKATVSAAEDDRIMAAANACDVTHGYVVSGATDTQKLYRAALVAPYGTPAGEVIEALVQAMGGTWAASVGGELHLRAGTYTAPVMTLTDDDLVVVLRDGDKETQEEINISVHRERADKVNSISPRIWDAAQGYKHVPLTPLRPSALVTADGQELAQELPLDAVFYAPQAQHIAGVSLRDSRDPLTLQASFKMRAYPLELFDVVQITLARYGWTNKTFMILAREWDRAKGVIRLTMKETAAAIYTPDAAFDPQGYAENTSLPNPWDIDPPTNLRVASGTEHLQVASDGTIITRAFVSWDAIADASILQGGHVEVQWSAPDTLDWQTVLTDGEATGAYITGVADGQVILVRARTRNTLARSDWTLQQAHQVIGKTAAPGVPTRVSLTQELVFFTMPSDLDLAGVRVRSLPGTVTSPVFSRGTDVIDGLVRASPARMERRLFGVQTVMVVAEDTSGNQSEPVSAVLNFGEPDINDAVWDRPYAAESFRGTFTDCALSGGAVLADVDAGSNLYALGNLYGEPDVYATLYKAMTWAADMAIIPYAGTLTLDATTAGNAVTIEYRILGSTTSNLYDSADVYAESNVYGTSGEWSAWPGALSVQRSTAVELRVSISSSSERGSISVFTITLTMDEVKQTFSSIAISEAGTRLAPAAGSPPRNWVGDLNAVYGMVAVDGSGAIAPRILDYSPVLGPLIELVDATGTPVAGTGTFIVEGNSDE